jgi:hypothetical protein
MRGFSLVRDADPPSIFVNIPDTAVTGVAGPADGPHVHSNHEHLRIVSETRVEDNPIFTEEFDLPGAPVL